MPFRFSGRTARALRRSTAALLLSGTTALSAQATELKVVSTIKPVHFIVQEVLKGSGNESQLLLKGVADPHSFALRPSHARLLQDADVIFRISPEIEEFFDNAAALTGNAEVVTLEETGGLTLRTFQDSGHDDHDDDHKDEHHEDESHDGHSHDNHDDDHKDEHHEDESHNEHGHDDHDDENDAHAGHGHAEGATDPHVWTDPLNAGYMAAHVAEVLGAADPENADLYAANALAFKVTVDSAAMAIAARMETVHQRPFLVFHDGLQYFEQAFGMNNQGVIAINPNLPPGAKSLAAAREEIEEHDIGCLVYDSNTNRRLVAALDAIDGVKTAEIDQLGAEATSYMNLLTRIADGFESCLAE